MIYVDFRNEIINKLNEKYGFRGWNAKLFLDGSTSKNKGELEFIHQTNMKYFGNRNDVLGGDFIRMSKKNGSGTAICRFEVKYLFDEFKKKDWEAVFYIVEQNVKSVDRIIPMDSMGKYDEINNMLIARPVYYEENKDALADCVFRQIGDIAIVLSLRLFEDKDNLTFFNIPKTVFVTWGISKEQAIDRALENSCVLYPAEVYSFEADLMREEIIGIGYFNFDLDKDILKPKVTLMCTSAKKRNGAVVLFYPGMQEKIYKAIGNEDYYVVFASTSAAHIHRCSEFDVRDILASLRSTNQAFQEDKMSNMVYRYYGDKNKLLPIEQP